MLQARFLIIPGVAACLAVSTAAFAQSDGGASTPAPGQEGKLGTTATGGAAGAEAARGTQGGAAPHDPAGVKGAQDADCPPGSPPDQAGCKGVLPGQEGKIGTTATGGAPGATAAPGTEGGPAPAQANQ
jgi:hypothetical protein